MALRSLVEGECGAPNPLMQVTAHFSQDKGLREEGIGFSRLETARNATEPSEQLVDEYLQEAHGTRAASHTFHMGALLKEMEDIESNSFPPAVDLSLEGQQWADEFAERSLQTFDTIWSGDFSNGPSASNLSIEPSNKWSHEYLEETENLQDEKWTSEFEKAELAATARNFVSSVDDPKLSATEFMKYVRKLGNESLNREALSDSEEDDWGQEYIKALGAGFPSTMSETDLQGNSSQPETGKTTDKDFWKQLEETWERVATEEEHPWLTDISESFDPFKDYEFENENPLLSHPDPLAEGKKKRAEGDLPSAVLLFEAAVQKDRKNPEAWFLLGTSQAENENDPAAIMALKKCLELDPSNLTAIMTLAVSYTNESYQRHAYETLKEWLRMNPKYSHLIPDSNKNPKKIVLSMKPSELINEEVQDLYLAAARMNSSNEIDPDVQCGLGVLFNLCQEYNKAVDCFQAALQVRPNDALIWNKLGATLANGNRSEEAVDAYRHALSLAPGFIRSRYNLGVTCINLEAYREAAEHFMTAINMQAKGQGPQGMKSSQNNMSSGIWTTLRMVLSLLDRRDLLEAVDSRDVAKLNQELGIES